MQLEKWQEVEIKKCASDFIYFCKTYVQIVHPKRGAIPFKLFPYQERVYKEFEANQFCIVKKFRQAGLTTLASIWCLWLAMFKFNQKIMLLSISDREAVAVGNDVSNIIDNLPDWLKPDLKTNSKHEKEFADTESVMWFYTPSAARSKSLSVLIVDEAAFIKDMDVRWAAMYPTLSMGGKAILISTVNGTGNLFHSLYINAQDKKNNFKVIDLHYTEHPQYVDEKWQISTRMNIGEKRWQQEYEGNFFGSGDTFIDIKTIASFQEKCIGPTSKLFPEWDNTNIDEMSQEEVANKNYIRGAMWVWSQPKIGKEYVISADCGEGQGGDFSTFQVLDTLTREQVAEFYSNTIKPYQFAQVLHQTGIFYNTALVVVESNGPGAATLSRLQHNLHYENLYYTLEGNKEKAGLMSNSKTRPLFVETLQTCLYNDLVKIKSFRLTRELNTYIFNRSKNRPEAARNAHDDLISSLMFGLYVIDLQERYLPIRDTITTDNISSSLSGKSLNDIQNSLIDGVDLEDFPEELEDLLYIDMSKRVKPPKRPNDAFLKEMGW